MLNPLTQFVPTLTSELPPVIQGCPELPRELWLSFVKALVQDPQSHLKDLASLGLTNKFFYEVYQRTMTAANSRMGILAHCVHAKIQPVKEEEKIVFTMPYKGERWCCIAMAEEGTFYFRSLTSPWDLLLIKGTTIRRFQILAELENVELGKEIRKNLRNYYRIFSCYPVKKRVILVGLGVSVWKEDENGELKHELSWFPPTSAFATCGEIFDSGFGTRSWYDTERNTLYIGNSSGEKVFFSLNFSTGETKEFVPNPLLHVESPFNGNPTQYFTYGAQNFQGYGFWDERGENYQIHRCYYKEDAETATAYWQTDPTAWITAVGYPLNDVSADGFKINNMPWIVFYNNDTLQVADLRTGNCVLQMHYEEAFLGNAKRRRAHIAFTEEFFFIFSPFCRKDPVFRIVHIPTQHEWTDALMPYLKEHLKKYQQVLSVSLSQKRGDEKNYLIIHLMGLRDPNFVSVSIEIEVPAHLLQSSSQLPPRDNSLPYSLRSPPQNRALVSPPVAPPPPPRDMDPPPRAVNPLPLHNQAIDDDDKAWIMPQQNPDPSLEDRGHSCLSTLAKIALVAALVLLLLGCLGAIALSTEWGQQLFIPDPILSFNNKFSLLL